MDIHSNSININEFEFKDLVKGNSLNMKLVQPIDLFKINL